MTNTDRNTRTLIVCFSMAVMALIPLRFVEVGQMMEVAAGQTQVLGETTQKVVTLPKAADIKQVGLEAPYNEIDGPCLTNGEYVAKMELLNNELNSKTISKAGTEELLKLAVSLDSRRCK
jgi:hypothetical protein